MSAETLEGCAMPEDHEHEERALGELFGDPTLSVWSDPDDLLSRAELEEAIATVLGTSRPDLPSTPDARERAMRKLALFQVIAPALERGAASWAEVLALLDSESFGQVEELLGGQTLREFLD